MKTLRCYICRHPIAKGQPGHAFFIQAITGYTKHYHVECREMYGDIEEDVVLV